MSFFIWWARQDLNLSYVKRFSQSIDHKADLPYPQNRPFIDLAAQMPFATVTPPFAISLRMEIRRQRGDLVAALFPYVAYLTLLRGFFFFQTGAITNGM